MNDENLHLFDKLVLYADLCTNHHGRVQDYERLVSKCERAGAVPKVQLFSKETFNREWPLPRTFAASVFRPSDVDWVMQHNPLVLKIASVEATYEELLIAVRETGKPVIVSTGGLDDDELVELLAGFQDYEPGLCLMHCVSQYPTPLENCNMLRISTLAECMEDMFLPSFVGWSCHTPAVWRMPLIAAVTQGASQFEVHVGLDLHKPQTDDERSSLGASELAEFMATAKTTNQILGTGDIEQDDRSDILEWRKRWQSQ